MIPPGILSAIGIKGFISIGLALALGITMWRADVISGQRDRAIQERANEQAAHAVTKASLTTLEKTMAIYIEDGKRRSEAARDALEAYQGQSQSLGRQIERLRSAASVAIPEPERCPSPAVVLETEGL